HQGQGHRVFLDARAALGDRFAQRFPAIAAACRAAGIDPATTPIPVRPAARWVAESVAGAPAARPRPVPPLAVPPTPEAGPVRQIASAGLGVLRDRAGLAAAIEALRPLAFSDHAAADPAAVA